MALQPSWKLLLISSSKEIEPLGEVSLLLLLCVSSDYLYGRDYLKYDNEVDTFAGSCRIVKACLALISHRDNAANADGEVSL